MRSTAKKKVAIPKRAWSELPNAAHIDAILADAHARPVDWCLAIIDAERVTPEPLHSEALIAGWCAAQQAGRVNAWQAYQTKYWCTAWDQALIAMQTLVAWDESAALLDLTPDALRTIVNIYSGDVKHQAVLLLPAVIARRTP